MQQDSNLNIITKAGTKIPIKEYQENLNKNRMIDDAVDLDSVEKMSFSNYSESSEQDYEGDDAKPILPRSNSKRESENTTGNG